jgi:hypothetical protein
MTWLLKLSLLFVFISPPAFAAGELVSRTTIRGFHVLTIDPSFWPKTTKKLALIFNGFFWHRYRVGEKIMLVKVTGLPNSVVLIPLDDRGHRLGEMRTELIL